MRKIYILLFTLMAAWSLIGCTRENLEQTDGNGEVLIRLKVDAIQTKSAGTADENYVESLQVLVFKDITAAPAKYVNLTSEITAGETTYEKEYTTLTDFGGFTPDELTNATVFAVANYSGDLSGVASLAAAKELAVNADGFLTTSPGGPVVKPAPRFIMIAEGGFTKDGGTNKAVADLTLTRLAAKVSLVIKYDDTGTHGLITTEDTVAGTTTVWTPMAEGNVRVYLENAVNNGKLGGDPADTQVSFRYADDHPAGEGTLTSAPFYTYPASWTEGSQDAPFLKLIQPWSYKTIKNNGTDADPVPVIIDQNVVELYYKIMLPGVTSLAPNMWYQPTVTLNVLGGESSRNMTNLTPTGFDILPWGFVGSTAGGLAPIAIDPAKYLAVERDTTFVNNGAGVSIYYVASGSATLTVEKIHKDVFGDNSTFERKIYPGKDALVKDDYAGKGGTGTITTSSTDPWFGITFGTNTEKPNQGVITLKHTLSVNFNDDEFAARPYIYHLKLHLDSEGTDTSLDRDFYIIQTPAILVEGELADGYVNVNDHVSYIKDGTANDGKLRSDSYVNVYTAPSYARPTGVNSDAYNLNYNSNTVNRDKNIKIHNIYSTSSAYNTAATTANPAGYIYDPRTTSSRYNASHSYYRLFTQSCLGSVNTYADLPNFSGSTNKCEYRIIVSFSSRDGYYIMDPRIKADELASTDDFLYKTLNYSTIKDGSTERAYSPFSDENNASNAIHTAVKQYSPTKRLGAEKMVAPEIMVASSYGRTTSMFFEAAVLRCASYQEDGYPAGRWRVPTEAEIETLVELSNKGAMPSLFAGEYFASSGRFFHSDNETFYNYKGSGTNPGVSYDDYRHSVRCVYDTWYWGREPVAGLKTGETLVIKQTQSSVSTEIERNLYNWSGFMPTK